MQQQLLLLLCSLSGRQRTPSLVANFACLVSQQHFVSKGIICIAHEGRPAACLCVVYVQMKYSLFMNGLRQENVQLNRKMLSELAIFEPHSFKSLVEQVQYMRGLGGSKPGSSSSNSSSIASRLTVGNLEGSSVGSSKAAGSIGSKTA
jgi:hypothetical protein